MTADTAFAVGKALAVSLGVDSPLIYIGTDTRESADMISQALMGGALSMGADCLFGGVMPTPAVAYNVKRKKAAAGVVVSASHNTPEYNGIKIFGADGYKLSDSEEERIEDVMRSAPSGYPARSGRLYSDTGGWMSYANYLIRTADADLSDLRFAVDCAHGAACRTAQYVFRKLGCKDCVYAACRPSGRLINSGCGATHPQKAAYIARSEGLRAAFCFDGDADRIIAADSGGKILDGDFLMYIIARELMGQNRLNSAGVVATVMTNTGVERAYKRLGIQLHRAPVGDKYVIQDMQKCGANLGGEQSGHIIMKDHSTTGDGILSALMIAKALKRSDFAELLSDIKLIPQKLVNVNIGGSVLNDERFIEKSAHWDGLLRTQGGRLLVRMSGTEQKLRIMAECEDEFLCAGACADLADLASKLAAS